MLYADVDNEEASNLTILTVFKFPMSKTAGHIRSKAITGARIMRDKTISIKKLRIFSILASKNKTLCSVYLPKHSTDWKGWIKESVGYRKYPQGMYVGNEKYFQEYFFNSPEEQDQKIFFGGI